MPAYFHAEANPPQKTVEFPPFRERTDPYAISRLISGVISDQQMPLSTLAERLGFSNIKHGVKEISHAIFDCTFSAEFLDALPQALGVDPALVEEAIAETRREIEDEARRYQEWKQAREASLFRPCIEVHHSYKRPTPCLPCDYSGYKFLKLPEEISSRPWSEQLEMVRNRIREHYDPQRGTPFGYITGYSYRHAPGATVSFDTAGNLLSGESASA